MEGRNRQYTTIFGGFDNPLSIIDRTTRRRIDKEIENLKNTINQSNLIDVLKHCNQHQQNIHLSQGHMEKSLG